MLEWLTDPNVMAVSDQIEKVNRKMFEKLRSRNDNLAVFFCKIASELLLVIPCIMIQFSRGKGLQAMPVSFARARKCRRWSWSSRFERKNSYVFLLCKIAHEHFSDIPIVKLEDHALAKEVGVFALPSVVFFRSGQEPTIYAGDLKNEEAILEWLLVQKDPSNEAIEEQSGESLLRTIDNSEAVAVFLYSHEDCETCLDVLQALENIDDDAKRQSIKLVKTIDHEFSESIGVTEYPALVYYQDGLPNLFEGDISAEEEVLDWLIEVTVESHIELITRPMLETMVEDIQYLAVYFSRLIKITLSKYLL